MSKRSLVDARNDVQDLDIPDGEPRREKLTNEAHSFKAAWYDYLYIGYSSVLYISDVVTDVLVSAKYFRNGDYIWFSLTLLCVVAASLVMMMFSLKWFYDDTDEEVSKTKTVVLHVLQIGPLKRYWDCYKTGKRSRVKDADKKHYNIYIEQWRDITMLRLFEVFIESAPQLVLQLYILAYNRHFDKEKDWLTALSACFSLLSLSTSIVSYSKALRDASENKGKMTWWAFGCQIVWRLSMVASRVVTLVLFASVYKSWSLLVIGFHWIGMTLWILWQKPSFCSDNRILKSMYPVVVGFVYVFCFFNVKDGFSRKRLVIFYVVMFAENCTLMGMWLPYRHEYGVVFVAAVGMVFGGFSIGVIALVLYYQCYHPTLPRQGICLRTSHDVPPADGIVHRLVCCNTCCIVRVESPPPPASELHVDIPASRGSLRRDVAGGETSPTFESEILIHKPSELQRQYSLEKEKIKKEKAERARRRNSVESAVGRRIAKSAVVQVDDVGNGTVLKPSSLPAEIEVSQLRNAEQRNENGLVYCTDDDKLAGSSSRETEVSQLRNENERVHLVHGPKVFPSSNGYNPTVGNSCITSLKRNSYNNVGSVRRLDLNHNTSNVCENDKDDKKRTCDDGVHCGTDDEKESTKSCDDGVHCGTGEEKETKTSCDDRVNCGTDKEKETKTSCDDRVHCGTDDEKETKPNSFSTMSQSVPNISSRSTTKPKRHVGGKRTTLDSHVQNTRNLRAEGVRPSEYSDNVNFHQRYSIVSDCISLSSSTSSGNEDDEYMEAKGTSEDKSSLLDSQGSSFPDQSMEDSEQVLERSNSSSNVNCKHSLESVQSDQVYIKRSPRKHSDNRRVRQSNRVSFPNFVATNLKRGRFSSVRRSSEDCTDENEDIRQHTVDFSAITSG